MLDATIVIPGQMVGAQVMAHSKLPTRRKDSSKSQLDERSNATDSRGG